MSATVKQPTLRLTKGLHNLSDGITRMLTWIAETRDHSARLAQEADGLTIKLRRSRHQVRQLTGALAQESTLALYGVSQAGKAWLLRQLVADAQGQLSTQSGGSLDYFTHINPGNQDCALVTRFSHRPLAVADAWPVELTLLTQTELTQLVLKTFLQSGGVWPDRQRIAARLEMLRPLRHPQPQPGISADEMVVLRDFADRHDDARQPVLARHYWPEVIALAPYLAVDDRARLFSLLWSDDATLSETWRRMAHTLQALDNAPRVYAASDLLVDNARLPAESLISPLAAIGLGTDRDRAITLQPANRQLPPVTVALGELSLLALELHIPLSTPPRQALFDRVEVLEIPGYGVPLEEDARHDRRRLEQQNPLAARLISAKRNLLLEYYRDRQAIDRLVVCAAAGQRNEAKAVGRQLHQWAMSRLTPTAHPAPSRKPALVWAITPFDAGHRQQHNADEAVQRHVGAPGEQWGTLLAQDQASVQRMANWLQAEMHPQDKLTYLSGQLNALRHEWRTGLLASWAPTPPAAKQQIADSLLKVLQTRTGLHGELLERLQPSRDALRQRYLTPEADTLSGETTPAAAHFGIGFDFDLFADTPPPVPVSDSRATHVNGDDAFADQVHRDWISHLRGLAEEEEVRQLLEVDKTTLIRLTEELITASFRLGIVEKLRLALVGQDTATSREEKVDRQVTRALTVLGDFIAWLGFAGQPAAQRPDSRVNRGEKIFARPPVPTLQPGQRLTRLSAQPANTTAFYIYDWLVGLDALITQNGSYSAAEALPDAQRQSLADALALFAE
ncbi:hypothetical protein PMPD1_2228 [Paramixta manurensis]|uniref:Virulence factor n=1 Tax=Paramixta manurensis TaxID=2740817 RepID=A0A6M8UPI8_9GAMM|nr:hypothetical protein PMPD1_2228 [Erwiniaceae bacterium PD-1]